MIDVLVLEMVSGSWRAAAEGEIVMATFVVTGDQYRIIDRRMCEIKRMLNQKDGSPLDPEAVAVALQDIVEGRFKADDTFAARFAATLAVCGFDSVSDCATPQNFPESIFGKIGEGHILVQLPETRKWHWTEGEIDVWLTLMAREGYEAATLADGLDWVSKNQREHLDGPVVFWASVSADGKVASLDGDYGGRDLIVSRRDGHWDGDCQFLLRKVQKAA